MALWKFRARNHPQQVATRGALHDVDDRETDPVFFGMLHERFYFTLDVAASAHNAKCARFFDAVVDGLKQPWAGERVWCNPPYSLIEPWVVKAWDEHKRGAELIVMLLPNNRCEQKWWQRYVEPVRDRDGGNFRVEFLPGRPRFIRVGSEGIGPNERPPFGLVLLVWTYSEAVTR